MKETGKQCIQMGLLNAIYSLIFDNCVGVFDMIGFKRLCVFNLFSEQQLQYFRPGF